MELMSNIGNHLLVTRGPWRGHIGEVVEIKELGCGLRDFVIKFDDGDDNTEYTTIPSSDCREYVPGSINIEAPFDITSYLSTQTMKELAKTVFSEKLNFYFDDVMKRRTEGTNSSVADQILANVAKQIVDITFNEYKGDVIAKFKQVIKSDKPYVDEEYEKSFASSISWSLTQAAEKYVKDHPDEIIDLMRDQISECAKTIANEQFSGRLVKVLEEHAKASLERMLFGDSES